MRNFLSGASPASLACASKQAPNIQYADAIEAWRLHASNCFPEEACGFILATGAFVPARNIDEDPINRFTVDAEDQIFDVPIVGFLHSHTTQGVEEVGQLVAPSEADMVSQIKTGWPWGVSVCDGENTTDPVWWGDQVQTSPLVGRSFVHGVWDCYSLVRDWHKLECGIVIPEYPRDDKWWQKDGEEAPKDLYETFFEQAGFERVYRQFPLPGDCFICRLHSIVRNHAGVYVGDNTILHHAGGTLSQVTAASRWVSKLDFLVRHKDLPEVDEE